MTSRKCIFVLGGGGALGKALTEAFVKKSWQVFAVDYVHCETASRALVLSGVEPLKQQFPRIASEVGGFLGDSDKFRCVVNDAGGWVGGGVNSESLFDDSEKMWAQSVTSSMMAAKVAAQFGASGCL
eukprot:RCo010987